MAESQHLLSGWTQEVPYLQTNIYRGFQKYEFSNQEELLFYKAIKWGAWRENQDSHIFPPCQPIQVQDGAGGLRKNKECKITPSEFSWTWTMFRVSRSLSRRQPFVIYVSVLVICWHLGFGTQRPQILTGKPTALLPWLKISDSCNTKKYHPTIRSGITQLCDTLCEQNFVIIEAIDNNSIQKCSLTTIVFQDCGLSHKLTPTSNGHYQ